MLNLVSVGSLEELTGWPSYIRPLIREEIDRCIEAIIHFLPFLLISLETMQLGHLKTTDHKYDFSHAHYLCTTPLKQRLKEYSARFPHEEFCDICCYIFLILVLNPGFPTTNTKFKASRRKY